METDCGEDDEPQKSPLFADLGKRGRFGVVIGGSGCRCYAVLAGGTGEGGGRPGGGYFARSACGSVD